jgi:hypothetical protein
VAACCRVLGRCLGLQRKRAPSAARQGTPRDYLLGTHLPTWPEASHEEAYAEQLGRASNDERATERAQKHAALRGQGKGHEAARELDAVAPPSKADADAANARAEKHAKVIQQGKGHEAARTLSGTD